MTKKKLKKSVTFGFQLVLVVNYMQCFFKITICNVVPATQPALHNGCQCIDGQTGQRGRALARTML